jgi:hypothetical protein
MALRTDECYHSCTHISDTVAILLWPPSLSINNDLQKRMTTLSREHHVYLRRVINLQQAIDIVDELKQTYKIMYLELHGIGTPTSICWPDQILWVGLNKDILSQLFNLLEPNACILTLSQQNGTEIKSSNNMVQYFSQIAKGRCVIGHTSNDLEHLTVKVRALNPVIVTCHRYNVDVTKMIK